MAEPYNDALKKAKRELANCDAEAEELERKRAKLRQTVAVLQSLTGVKVQNEQSLTQAILMVLKAASGCVTAAEVVETLRTMGYDAQTPSVATILSRHLKNQQINSFFGPGHSVGYEWRGGERTKAERLEARRMLAAQAPKK